MLEDTLVLAMGEFGRSPERGVSTSAGFNNSDGWTRSLAVLLHGGDGGCGHETRLRPRQE